MPNAMANGLDANRTHFLSGDWRTMQAELRKTAPQGFDLIVSAETAYSLASIDGLVELIQAVLAPTGVVYVIAPARFGGKSARVLVS